MTHPIVIHTRGSCDPQTKIGGWAAILQCGDHQRILQDSAADTTVRMMELTATIEALRALKHASSTVQLFTDSNYIVCGVNEWMAGWLRRDWKNTRGEPVANLPLWQQLKALLDQHTVTVTWILPRENVKANDLAQAARMAHPSDMPQKSATGAGTTPSQAVTEFHLLIAGSRYATREALAYARRVVRRAHALGYTILVGDNPKGVDMAVVQECRHLNTTALVVGVTNRPRNGGCSHGSYVKIESDTYRAAGGRLFDRYHARDRWMVDNANRGIFIWNGSSQGTKLAHDYMVSRQKEAHLITFERVGARQHG